LTNSIGMNDWGINKKREIVSNELNSLLLNIYLNLPVSGFVSKWVRLFDMCRQSKFSLDKSVEVSEDFLGNNVPFTWDNSKSG